MSNIDFEYKKRQLRQLCVNYFVEEKLQTKEWNEGWSKYGIDKSELWARKVVLEVLVREGVFDKIQKVLRESITKTNRFEVNTDEEVVLVLKIKSFNELLSIFHDEFSDDNNLSKILDLMFDFNRMLLQTDTEFSEVASFQQVDWKIMLKAVSMWMQIDSFKIHNQAAEDARDKCPELKGPKNDDIETHQKVKEFKLFAFEPADSVQVTQNVIDRVLDFIVKLINKCDQIVDTFQPVIMLERWSTGKVINPKLKKAIRNALEAQLNESELYDSILDISKENANEYKAKFCCHWLIDNYLKLSNEVFPKIPLVKLSSNRLIARNEFLETPIVRTPFPVSEGAFFYEVTLISTEIFNSSTFVGWISRNSITIREGSTFVGLSGPSIGLNVNLKYAVHNSMPYYELFNRSPCSSSLAQPGDVIGCAIDADNSTFLYFYNGFLMLEIPFDKSTLPYFAAASLGGGQQCHFNFGQEPFKHKPKFLYSDFHTASHQNLLKYRFWDVERAYNATYWQKQQVAQNRMQLFFADQAQYQFNDMVKSFENEIRKGKVALYGMVLHFKDTFRLVQSFIEVLQLDTEKMVYLFADWFYRYLRIFFTWIRAGEFCEILYPYLQLNITEDNKYKHLNICIILAHLIGCFIDDDFPVLEPIQTLVFEYFIRMYKDSRNKWIRLFAIICIDELGSLSDEQRAIVGDEMKQILDWKKTSFEQKSIFDALNANRENLYNYQLYFLAKQLTGSNRPEPPKHKVQATLHPMDKTRYVKLSSDLLSARNDSALWQSVRSVCSVSQGEIGYYEVIFLAPCEFRIGWATINLNLKDQLGNDQTSVGFERLCNLICYQDKTHKLQEKDRIPWSAGEVIGCLIDLTAENDGKFTFTINGKQIKSPIEIKLPTKKPYHATVSLAPHQQCLFNFGQTKFLYASKVIIFTNLYETALNVMKSAIEGQHTEIRIGDVKNSLVMVNSELKARDINIETKKMIKEDTFYDSKSNRPLNDRTCQLCYEANFMKLSLLMCCNLVLCKSCTSSLSTCPKCKV